MAHRIQLRGGTQAAAIAANPTLRSREIGIETDTGLFKVGNGSQAYIDLAYGGLQGPTGNRIEFRYQNLTTPPPAPTGENPVGWELFPTTPPTDFFTWITVAELNEDNILQTLWSIPAQLSGPKGNTGETGLTGLQGPIGGSATAWLPSPQNYDMDEPVYRDGILWLSMQDTNVDHDPVLTEGVWWQKGERQLQQWANYFTHTLSILDAPKFHIPDTMGYLDTDVDPIPEDISSHAQFYDNFGLEHLEGGGIMETSNVGSFRGSEYYIFGNDGGTLTGFSDLKTATLPAGTFDTGDELLFGAWFRITRPGVNAIYPYWSNIGGVLVALGITSPNGLTLYIGAETFAHPTFTPDTDWHHIAGYVNTTTKKWGIIVDGVYTESTIDHTLVSFAVDTATTYISQNVYVDYLDVNSLAAFAEPFWNLDNTSDPQVVIDFYHSGEKWSTGGNTRNLVLSAQESTDIIEAKNPILLPAPATVAEHAIQKVQLDDLDTDLQGQIDDVPTLIFDALASTMLFADKIVTIPAGSTGAEIQAIFDAQPKLLNNYKLDFQFEDGTYSIDTTLNLHGFAGGEVTLLGNSNDWTVSATKSVNLEGSATLVNGTLLSVYRCSHVDIQFIRFDNAFSTNINTLTMGISLCDYVRVDSCTIGTTSSILGQGLSVSSSNVNCSYTYFEAANYTIKSQLLGKIYVQTSCTIVPAGTAEIYANGGIIQYAGATTAFTLVKNVGGFITDSGGYK